MKNKQAKNIVELHKHINAFSTSYVPILINYLEPFLNHHPYWTLAFQLSIGLYGYYMVLKQEDLNEVIQFIENNPEHFTKKIVSSKEFKNGFTIFLQDYLKSRTKRKKKILKKVLLGFTKSEDMPEFNLERINDVILKLSIEGIDGLKMIKDFILPVKKKELDKDTQRRIKMGETFVTKWNNYPLPRFAALYFTTNYGIDSQIARQRHGFPQEMSPEQKSTLLNEMDAIQDIFYNSLDELISLGIVKMNVSKGGGGMSMTGGTTWDLSSFGYDLMKYIEE